jgi:hypothetical protein
MIHRARSHSPGKSPKEKDNLRRSIKLNSEVDYSNVGKSFTDPFMQQIKEKIPAPNKSGGPNNANIVDTAAVTSHFEDILLPEEWLELEPIYLRTPPSLETKEFQDILEVRREMSPTH